MDFAVAQHKHLSDFIALHEKFVRQLKKAGDAWKHKRNVVVNADTIESWYNILQPHEQLLNKKNILVFDVCQDLLRPFHEKEYWNNVKAPKQEAIWMYVKQLYKLSSLYNTAKLEVLKEEQQDDMVLPEDEEPAQNKKRKEEDEEETREDEEEEVEEENNNSGVPATLPSDIINAFPEQLKNSMQNISNKLEKQEFKDASEASAVLKKNLKLEDMTGVMDAALSSMSDGNMEWIGKLTEGLGGMPGMEKFKGLGDLASSLGGGGGAAGKKKKGTSYKPHAEKRFAKKAQNVKETRMIANKVAVELD